MSFANFGIGLGAFAQGLNTGIDAGQKLGGLIQQGKLARARKQGMADARAARSSAIDNLVKVGSAPNADNTMTMPTYSVGDQTYASHDEARKAAEGQVGSLEDFYAKVAVPKIYEQYLEIDPEKAEAWRKWNEDKQVRQGQRYWASALMKANMGDFEGFGQDLVRAYNTRGYFDDGLQVKDWETLKDEAGNITGAKLTIKGPDGKEYTQTINGMEDAYRMGSFLLSPENVFNTGWSEIQSAQKARLEMAKEYREYQRQSALQEQRDQAAMDRTITGKQMDAANRRAAVDAKSEALRRAGYSEAFIRDALPELLGIGSHKKAAAPEEVRRMLHQARLSDFSYQRKSPQEQAQIIQQDMQLIYGDQQPSQNMKHPMQGGIAPQSGGRRPMILDTQTGQMIPYQR